MLEQQKQHFVVFCKPYRSLVLKDFIHKKAKAKHQASRVVSINEIKTITAWASASKFQEKFEGDLLL